MGIPAPFNGSPPRLLHEYTLYETLLESMKLETDVLDETCALQFELVFFWAHSRLHEYDYAVFCYSWVYVFVKLSRNQSWVNLCFLSHETWSLTRFWIACSRFLILAFLRIWESRIASRINWRLATDCQLIFERYCNCLNGWFTDEIIFDWLTEWLDW